MKKLLLLLLIPFAASAGEARLSWTHATLNTDGSPIAPIVRTEINYGVCNATRTGLQATPAPVVAPVAYPANTYTVSGLANGAWCFQARTVVSGAVSDWTAFVNKDVVNVPNPPSGLTLLAQTVYTVVKRQDRFVMLPVGTAPASTPCLSDQYVNGYHVVPRAVVTWSGTVRPDVVVGTCG